MKSDRASPADANFLSFVAATPPLGWNSWNQVRCFDLTEDVVKAAADAIVARGLRDAGYAYIVIDDCWQGGRASDGRLYSHPERFPSGIPALAEYVHARGLRLGIYGVPGSETCANFYDEYPIVGIGSLGHERTDVDTFVDWEVDFLKYDWCRADETDGLRRENSFGLMRSLLETQQRPVLYAISEYGVAEPWKWAKPIAHQWRTTQDILPTWESIVGIIEAQAELAEFAGPGGWNDPDMLQFGNGDLTHEQNYSHFAMWCMLAAPLFLGTDIAHLSDADIDILRNPELLAISQDPLGQQARRLPHPGPVQVWVRNLANGDRVAAFFNPSGSPERIDVSAALGDRTPLVCSEVGNGDRQGTVGAMDFEVAGFGTRILRLGGLRE